MGSLPKPAHLVISIDEWQVAQGKVDAVDVEIKWRAAHDDSALTKLLAVLPPRNEFVSIGLVDGRTELAFKSWQGIRFGKGPRIFESARSNYEAWAGGPGDALPAARKQLTEMFRQYVPNFDNYADREQVDFLIRTQEKVNAIHDSVEALTAHLEYSAPDKHKALPPLRKPLQNIRAAVFSDVMRSSRRAGELLDIPLPPGDEFRHENETVRKMAKLGRELLCGYFGEGEWTTKVQRMREHRQWWERFETLLDDPKEQIYALLAKARGTTSERERLSAETDGFDEKLDEWIAVVVSRFKLEETLDQWEDLNRGNAGNAEWISIKSERRSIQAEQFRIQATDERFDEAFSVFDTPPQ
jgi:hypothetical protein